MNTLFIILGAWLCFLLGLAVGGKLLGGLAYRDGKEDQKYGSDLHKYWERWL